MDQIIEAFRQMWIRWSDAEGKTNVEEYWFAILAHVIVVILLSILSGILSRTPLIGWIFTSTIGIYGFVAMIPLIMMTIRRLHDTNRSGWWILISLVPMVGWIILLIFLIQPSIKA